MAWFRRGQHGQRVKLPNKGKRFHPALDVLESRLVLSFTTPVSYGVARNPQFMVTADFNGDGHADAATTSYDDGVVSVLLGQGNGILQSTQSYSVGGPDSAPVGLAAGDFDEDGLPDLAVVKTLAAEVAVLLNQGDGTFPISVPYYSGGLETWWVAVSDLDLDGHLDLVVTNPGPFIGGRLIGNSVGVLRGQGDGTFEPVRMFRVGQGPWSAIVADFNGDGAPDIAVTNYESDNVSVLLNIGGTGQILFAPPANYPIGRDQGPAILVAGDFNNDEELDLVITNRKSETISLFQGVGQGTLRLAGTILERGLRYPSQVVADFNQDGCQDFVVTRFDSNNLGLYLGNCDMTFATPPQNYATGTRPVAVVSADLNEDGWPDLLVNGGSPSGFVAALLNDQTWSGGSPGQGGGAGGLLVRPGRGGNAADLATSLSGSEGESQPIACVYGHRRSLVTVQVSVPRSACWTGRPQGGISGDFATTDGLLLGKTLALASFHDGTCYYLWAYAF